VIHRRRDRAEAPAPAAPPIPSFERLLDPPGRAVLERLVREHGARRAFLLRELAAWHTAHGGPPADEDLTALLEHHGLARAFAHRERDELLHALRAARGDRGAAAKQVGLDGEAFERALDRLGAAAEAERLREDRRAELRARPTIAERARLVAAEADRLADLGILEELERDLRDRLGEHLRALRAGAGTTPLRVAFARSVSLAVPDAVALALRLGVKLEDADTPGPRRTAKTRPAGGGRPAQAPRRNVRASAPPRALRPGRGPGRAAPGGAPRPRPAAPRGPPRAGPRGRK
jgi:hypothetical protein